MPKRDPTLEKLEAIAAMRSAQTIDREATQKLLRDRSPHVIAKAAELCGQQRLSDLSEDVRSAFRAAFEDPVKRDPNCGIKTTALRALIDLEEVDDDDLMTAARHVQLEPSFGPPVDTAVELRSVALVGLARTGSGQVELARGLADGEAPVRRAAAQALGMCPAPGCDAVLWCKILLGDEDPDVLCDALVSVLQISKDHEADVGALTRHTDADVASAAALALGSATTPGAYEALEAALAITDEEVQRAVRTALAILRDPRGVGRLLEEIREGEAGALESLEALSALRRDDELPRRVHDAVSASGARRLADRATALFGLELDA